MNGEVKPGDKLPDDAFFVSMRHGEYRYWNGSAWVPLKVKRSGDAVRWVSPPDWQRGGIVEGP